MNPRLAWIDSILPITPVATSPSASWFHQNDMNGNTQVVAERIRARSSRHLLA